LGIQRDDAPVAVVRRLVLVRNDASAMLIHDNLAVRALQELGRPGTGELDEPQNVAGEWIQVLRDLEYLVQRGRRWLLRLFGLGSVRPQRHHAAEVHFYRLRAPTAQRCPA